jgi:hypothetical protein
MIAYPYPYPYQINTNPQPDAETTSGRDPDPGGQKSGSETMFTSHALFCQGSGSALIYIRKMYLDQKLQFTQKFWTVFDFCGSFLPY